jgi:hypothetical protein
MASTVPDRRTAALAFTAIALVLLLTLLNSDHGEQATLLPPTEEAEEMSNAPTTTRLGAADPGIDEKAMGPRSRATVDANVQAHDGSGQAPGDASIRGKVLVLDLDGNHVVSTTGYIKWRVHLPDGAVVPRLAAIRDDEWTLKAALNSLLEVEEVIWSASHSAYAELDSEVVVPADEAEGLQIQARLVPGLTLNVLGAANMEHLEGVSFVLETAVAEGLHQDTPYPPSIFLQRGHHVRADSPVRMHQMPGTRLGWVSAKGHAWKRIAFLGNEDQEMSVILEEECHLDVRVVNLPSDAPSPTLFVYRLESEEILADAIVRPFLSRSIDEARTVSLPKFPPGDYLIVAVPVPHTRFVGPRLGQVLCHLDGRGRQEVILDLARKCPQLASLAFEVRSYSGLESLPASNQVMLERLVPGALRAPEAALFYPLGKQQPGDGAYVGRWEGLVPGSYLISVLPHGTRRLVELEAGESREISLSLPAQVLVSIAVEDAEEGRSLRGASVSYRPAESTSATAWRESNFGHDNTYRFQCAPGEYTVSMHVWGRIPRMETVRVDLGGGNRHTFELERSGDQVLRVRAVQGNARVCLPTHFWTNVRILPVDKGTGCVTHIVVGRSQVAGLGASDADRADFHLGKPGVYDVILPELPEFIIVGERTSRVSVPEAGETELVFTVVHR